MSTENRVLRLENAFSTLIELAQKSDERMVRLEGLQVEAEKRMTRLESVVANSYVDMRDRYNALVDAQVKSEEKIAQLADAQRNLTALVDRYFSEGRNGK